MCRTMHALLSSIICGIQMLVRVFMTTILMLENLLRMFLQTLYNLVSFILQCISLIPICCIFLITSRMKCFMCGGGGPCPVNRGGACDCLMSLVAVIILFFIFRATGVLDKIFYSIGYARTTTKIARFVPTIGPVTECSRNDTDTEYMFYPIETTPPILTDYSDTTTTETSTFNNTNEYMSTSTTETTTNKNKKKKKPGLRLFDDYSGDSEEKKDLLEDPENIVYPDALEEAGKKEPSEAPARRVDDPGVVTVTGNQTNMDQVYTTWVAIITASSLLCGFLCHMIWQKLVVDPTFTVVESTQYSTKRISFPAVTLCDSEPVYGPNTDNITAIFRNRAYEDKQIQTFYASVITTVKKAYVPLPYLKKMYKILAELDYSVVDIMSELAKPCNKMLVECMWRGNAHDCSEMFFKVLTVFGICCQFDMDYFQKNAPNTTNFVPGFETEDGLSIVVNGEKIPFQGDPEPNGYLWLFINDKKINLTIMDYPTIVTSNGIFDISINLWVIDSSKEVQGLRLETRKCLLQSEILNDDLYQPFQECLSRLILKDVVKRCSCLPYGFTARKLHIQEADYPKCSWDRYLCVLRRIREAKSDLKDVITGKGCWQRCDYVQYATEIDYIKKEKKDGVNDSYSKVAIHFSTSTCIKYRRELLYVWDQMLANLGGIFGLCLGGSMISVIEITWFAIDFVISIIRAMWSTKTKQKKNKIFTITKNK